jgi:hypothetical protein
MTLNVYDIAKVCHEANRALRAALGEGQYPAWEDCPERKQELVCKGVRFHIKCRGKATPKQSHYNWILGMQADGWTYGEEFDADAKKHPCLVPFDELPPEQQLKDELFANIVRMLMPFFEEHD